MPKLNIIKASAGSGKTYRLTEEYLSLLFKENTAYFRHILAVTFTNKATAEMKERIVAELAKLANNKECDHLKTLLQKTGFKEDHIREKAGSILKKILHGYSWFRVETIDSFFQRIIRSFTREMGIPGQYNIELDTEKVLSETVDLFIDGLGENRQLIDWLLEFTEDKIIEGKGWNIRNDIIGLGKQLFNEKVMTHGKDWEEKLQDKDFIKNYRNSLHAIISRFETRLKDLAADTLSIIDDQGYVAGDFFQGTRGPLGYFQKLNNKNIEQPNSYVQKILTGNSDWASGKCKDKPGVNQLGQQRLLPILSEIVQILENDYASYNTALSIKNNFYALGILSNLSDELNKYKKEQNIFLISETANFINRMIDQNDAPFIYEKTGNHFRHYMIDEFQDTSGLQWENFKPLISNSLSTGNDSLLVGDVKQSIYRWRNSEWEILASQVDHDFSTGIQNHFLQTNWRSTAEVIQFNNTLFKATSEILDREASNLFSDQEKRIKIEQIYSDVEQSVSPKASGQKGYVNCRFISKDEKKDNPDYHEDFLVERINQLLEKDFRPGDIAVLVRRKEDGKKVADFIIEANKENSFTRPVEVLSNESLFLTGSAVVRAVINALYLVYDRDDAVHAAALLSEYLTLHSADEEAGFELPTGRFTIQQLDQFLGAGFVDFCKSLRHRPLYELTEKLIRKLKLNSFPAETVFLHSFLDIVYNYSGKNSSDLSGFLEYWEEEGEEKSISISGEENAITILTIHKAKGLEYPAVLIPFCDWSLYPKANQVLWCSPEEEPFNELSLVPVGYNNLLENSSLSSSYNQEKYRTYVDNLNLMYVAFTRAGTALFTCSVYEDKLTTTGDLLYQGIREILCKPAFKDSMNDEGTEFTSGELVNFIGREEGIQSVDFKESDMGAQVPELKIASKAGNLFSEVGNKPLDAAKKGHTWHHILEQVVVRDDLKKAVKSAIHQGIVSVDEGDTIHTEMQKALQNEEVAHWFDGSYKVLNEVDIVLPGNEIRRPDRVMIAHDEVVVVDYKFGSEDEERKHKKQVETYMELIREMGYKEVSGYIWYVHKHNVVKL